MIKYFETLAGIGAFRSAFEKVASVGMSDVQLYKQAGNSIVVPILVEIAKNLKKLMQLRYMLMMKIKKSSISRAFPILE